MLRNAALIAILLAGCATSPPAQPAGPSPEERAEAYRTAVAALMERHAAGETPTGADGLPPPVPITRMMPQMPAAALKDSINGACVLSFDLRTSGLVAAESIVADCTHDMFVAPSRRAVATWTYKPTSVDGQLVERKGLVVVVEPTWADYPKPAAPPSGLPAPPTPRGTP